MPKWIDLTGGSLPPTPKTTIPEFPTVLEAAFRAAVEAVDPGRLVRSRLAAEGGSVALLDDAGRPLARHDGPVYVAAAGKAASAMAQAVAEMLGPGVRGDAIGPEGTSLAGGITMHKGGHPLPTAQGSAATNLILKAITRSAPDTLVLVLLSGGASAMLVRPAPGLTLEEKVAVTRQLLACGASIAEINVVRKHLSAVKGGGIARHAGGRSVWALILSDVIGDDIGTIGSGPTAPDLSSFGDALEVVVRYGLEGALPASVVEHLREGLAGRRPETPKVGDLCFERVRNEIVGSNKIALDAAASCASERGFTTLVCDVPVSGDTTEAATRFAAELVRAFTRCAALPASWPAVRRLSACGELGRGGGIRNSRWRRHSSSTAWRAWIC